MMFRLTNKEICALSELEVADEYPPSLDHHREISRATVKKIAGKIEDMANNGDSVGEVLKALRAEI